MITLVRGREDYDKKQRERFCRAVKPKLDNWSKEHQKIILNCVSILQQRLSSSSDFSVTELLRIASTGHDTYPHGIGIAIGGASAHAFRGRSISGNLFALGDKHTIDYWLYEQPHLQAILEAVADYAETLESPLLSRLSQRRLDSVVRAYRKFREDFDPQGWVYVAYSPALLSVKIGFTDRDNPLERVKEIEAQSKSECKLIHLIRGYFKDENRLHKRFAAQRLSGEWFRPEGELLEWLNSEGCDLTTR